MIVVKESEFTETEHTAEVVVPLKGVKSSKTDIYSNDLYIKVNFPPFFFEADLFQLIKSNESTATVGNGIVRFVLVKAEKGLWGSLRPVDLDAESLSKRRDEAYQRDREREEEKRKQKDIEKRKEHDMLIRRQLETERANRAKIEEMKQRETDLAKDSLKEFTDSISGGEQKQSTVTEQLSPADKSTRHDSAIFDVPEEDSQAQSSATAVAEEDEAEKDLDMEAIRQKVKAQMAMRNKEHVRPAPRQAMTITVSFTERGLIPTQVARETEDAKWKERIHKSRVEDAQKRSGSLHESLSVDEKNPIFLKDKGNAFFKSGNYDAAISAFTAALAIEPDYLQCMTNRAACHLKLGSSEACVSDCDEALEILRRQDEADSAASLAKGLGDGARSAESVALEVKTRIRRGAALVKLGRLTEAVEDYEKSKILDPRSQEVSYGLECVKSMMAIR